MPSNNSDAGRQAAQPYSEAALSAIAIMGTCIGFTSILGWLLLAGSASLGGDSLTALEHAIICITPVMLFITMTVIAWFFTQKTKATGCLLFLGIVLTTLTTQVICYYLMFNIFIQYHLYLRDQPEVSERYILPTLVTFPDSSVSEPQEPSREPFREEQRAIQEHRQTATSHPNAVQVVPETAPETSVPTEVVVTSSRQSEALTNTNLVEAIHRQQTPVSPTEIAITPTERPQGLPNTSLEEALSLAQDPVGHNADWQTLFPYGFIYEFDGVPMVLIPAGCFQMGNDPDSDEGRSNGGRQCFEQPFWLDLHEVSQEQFSTMGGIQSFDSYFEGALRPVETISWFEARDYCVQQRGAALPTEAEWEYAARGPDALSYPWGNDWNPDFLIWNRSDSQGTSEVGSIPEAASWVGALDMAGNVAEWTRNLLVDYPYASGGYQESNAGENGFTYMALRGGSWLDTGRNYHEPPEFRTASRSGIEADFVHFTLGFRCMRPFDEADVQTTEDSDTPNSDTEIELTSAALSEVADNLSYEEVLRLAQIPVNANRGWDAMFPNGFIQEFDGVPMVLVPAGCLQMGNDSGGIDSSASENAMDSVGDGGEQCFAPFWIDLYEVYQQQFADFGYLPDLVFYNAGARQPVTQVSWFEAREFCQSYRQANLPTEAEWEYAARGPDELYYPWGNEWDDSLLVWNNQEPDLTLPDVGSLPEGRSWVGAMDMAGSVFELTRSIALPYPYNPYDGREAPIFAGDETIVIARSGGWLMTAPFYFRMTTRIATPLTYDDAASLATIGFRCVRPVERIES